MKKILLLQLFVMLFCISNAQILKSDAIKITTVDDGYFHRGYRGFVEGGVGGGSDESNTDYTEFSLTTMHGVQIVPKLFIGGGLGIHNYSNDDTNSDDVVVIPIFTTARFDIINKKISPFIDGRLGYSAGDAEGVYFSFGGGCRFKNVSLSIAYVLQQYEYEEKYTTNTGSAEAFFFRLAFDWGARN